MNSMQLLLAVALLTSWLSGCNSAWRENDEPLTPVSSTSNKVMDPESVQFVNDLTRPWGLTTQEVQGVTLITGLKGTGSDPGPTAERAMLLSEMQTRGVERPSEVLASNETSIAMVRGKIPPGARKGDRFDLEIRVPAGSETSSLHGGWLMQTRLKEYAKLNNRLSTGHVLATASGDVLTDDFLEADGDRMFKKRGRILNGGVVGRERNLGLVLRDEFTSVRASARIAKVINQRFHMFHRGNKEGVATPKRDNFIELRVHPRYRDNIIRYLRVVQQIAVRETPSDLTNRLELLRSRLADPTTASMAAVQLESIGDAAVSILEEQAASSDSELRFYAAEALAYLDESSAAEPLMLAARDEPAFRWRALTALGSMDQIDAHEMLISLLHEDSAETRYGAFYMLRKVSPSDPMIRGQIVDERFYFHTVSSTGAPMVHISKHKRPEIVMFGSTHPLREPVVVFAGSEIVVRSNDAGRLTIRKLTSGDDDPEVKVAPELKAMVAGIVELGGGYPEVVQAISEAKSTGALASRLEFSALPELNRAFRRGENSDSDIAEINGGSAAEENLTGSAANELPLASRGSNPIDELLGEDESVPELMNSLGDRAARRGPVPRSRSVDGPVDDFGMPGLQDKSRDQIRSREIGRGFDDLSDLQPPRSERDLSRDVQFQVSSSDRLSVRSPNGGSVEFSDLADPAGR